MAADPLRLYALRNTQDRRCANCGGLHTYLTWLCRVIVSPLAADLVRYGPSWSGIPVLLPRGFPEPTVPLESCVRTYRVDVEKVRNLLLPKH